MKSRARRPLAAASILAALLHLACATSRPPARRFAAPEPADIETARRGWSAALERAATLPPSRLLYDARLGRGRVAAVPGTLAVTYDGSRIRRASLTGPFGSPIAEYRDGRLTGEDRRAFLVDPDALRSILAGVWNGGDPRVEGRDLGDVLLSWSGGARVEAVMDLSDARLRSLEIDGSSGHLVIVYSGDAHPWPERVALRDARSGRSLMLKLVATEPMPPS